LCAMAPGQAVIHWQFSPPAPPDRDTEIVDVSGSPLQNRTCYEDYLINIIGPTVTPTITNTPTRTPTPRPTVTGTPPTATNTPLPGCEPAWSVVSSRDPSPSLNYLFGVAPVSANDVWAVGIYDISTTV